jgi:hypothetical protein
MTTTNFGRWVARAPDGLKEIIQKGVAAFDKTLEARGFVEHRTTFDGISVPAHCINYERKAELTTDFILVVFDKRYRRRFQVTFGSKGPPPQFAWIKAGSIVWRPGGRSMRYRWWGAEWWHVRKTMKLEDAIASAASKLPQVICYLETGETGDNLSIDTIGANLSA